MKHRMRAKRRIAGEDGLWACGILVLSSSLTNCRSYAMQLSLFPSELEIPLKNTYLTI